MNTDPVSDNDEDPDRDENPDREDERGEPEPESQPVRVVAKVVRTKKSSRWIRQMAFHFWASHGGPECEISEVARQFDIPRQRAWAWCERDGWRTRWAAMQSETDRRLDSLSQFRCSEYVSVEQLDKAIVSLFIGMTGVISEGGLQARPRSMADRPIVSFKIGDYLVVVDRLRDMLRREEDRNRLSGAAANFPIGIAKTDLRLLAELPPEKIRAIRLLAEGYMENLKRLSLVKPDAPSLGFQDSPAEFLRDKQGTGGKEDVSVLRPGGSAEPPSDSNSSSVVSPRQGDGEARSGTEGPSSSEGSTDHVE